MDLGPSALGPEARVRALGSLSTGGTDELDVLVVGGGVVGAGVALDAVTRGLSTGLLEQRDLASGTSSRSSKLIHGGLRYLEMLDFGLVREALQERGLLLTRLAPHLVRPVPFLYPLTHRGWERPYVGVRAAALRRDGAVRPRRGGAAAAPAPDPQGGRPDRSGLRARIDRGRDPLLRLPGRRRPAGRHAGPHRRRARRPARHPGEGDRLPPRGRAGGRRTRDRPGERSSELEVRARVVVNAAGVWTDEIQEMVGGRGALHVQASKGIHLVVPRDRIRSEAGFIVRTETSVLFVIPWGRHWIIGTTDTPWDLDKAHPAASRADIDYVLDHVNAILREPLDHEDVEGVYAGLRPLLSGRVRADLADLPRAHRGHAGARHGDDRRRQAHDLPRDGPRRRRRRRPLAGDDRHVGARVDHPPGAAARRRRVRDPHQPAGPAGPPRPACTSPGSTTCSAATATWSTTSWR